MTWGVGQRLSKCQIFGIEPVRASFLPFYSFSKPWLVNFSVRLFFCFILFLSNGTKLAYAVFPNSRSNR